MASALHIKDLFVAILINLVILRGGRRISTKVVLLPPLPLPRKDRSRPVRRAALKKAPSSTPAFGGRMEVFGGPLDVLSFGIFKGEFEEGGEGCMVVGRMGHNK